MRRLQIFLLLIILVGTSFGYSKPKTKEKEKETEIAKSVFEFTSGKGEVRKVEIRLVQKYQEHIAYIKALLYSGVTLPGQVLCQKKKSDEYYCQRDDDGGAFTLQTGKNPKLIYTYFSTAEEGSLSDAAIGSPGASPITIEGKNK
ncbi:MAG: hypothetical protein ACXWC9_01415 [Pseudobdellovibrionaceae bacterium]